VERRYESRKNRQLDILIASAAIPSASLYFKFTGPYWRSASVIVVAHDTPFVADISALLQKKFAVVATTTRPARCCAATRSWT